MAARGRKSLPSKGKAKEMLRHGEVGGDPLSKKQKGLFGMLAGGGLPSRMRGRRPLRGK